MNCLEDITIEQTGDITELKQQDYNGKRVFVRLIDSTGDSIESKIDLGVHKNLSIEQEEYCFDIAFSDEGANLLINSKEQMFAEKLKSLLKFGKYTTRYKDIFDLRYLSELVDKQRLIDCIRILVYNEPRMKENNTEDIRRRVDRVFSSKEFVTRLSQSRKNWLGLDIPTVLRDLQDFMNSL